MDLVQFVDMTYSSHVAFFIYTFYSYRVPRKENIMCLNFPICVNIFHFRNMCPSCQRWGIAWRPARRKVCVADVNSSNKGHSMSFSFHVHIKNSQLHPPWWLRKNIHSVNRERTVASSFHLNFIGNCFFYNDGVEWKTYTANHFLSYTNIEKMKKDNNEMSQKGFSFLKFF